MKFIWTMNRSVIELSSSRPVPSVAARLLHFGPIVTSKCLRSRDLHFLRASLVRIGNSRGLRIPKPVLEQCGFGSVVELRVEPGRLVVLPVAPSRAGWDEAFATQGNKQELLLPDEVRSAFDDTEWTW